VGPTLVREAARVAAPIQRMKRSQAALDEMVDKAAWKRPEGDALAADQLDRFLQVRRRIDQAVRDSDGRLDVLPRKHVRSLEELRQVPGVIEGVSGVVATEMDAFVTVGMTPAEYHWLERLVYTRWRGALRRAGTYPTALRAAALEVAAAAARESDPRVHARLERLAAEMRARTPAPPEGLSPAIHELLLARLDDIERYSMDDTVRPTISMPR
jgi:hypothetical protein